MPMVVATNDVPSHPPPASNVLQRQRDDSVSNRFHLVGNVMHTGLTLNSGHYYADVRCSSNWIRVNDTSVQHIEWDPCRLQSPSWSPMAYVQMYSRPVVASECPSHPVIHTDDDSDDADAKRLEPVAASKTPLKTPVAKQVITSPASRGRIASRPDDCVTSNAATSVPDVEIKAAIVPQVLHFSQPAARMTPESKSTSAATHQPRGTSADRRSEQVPNKPPVKVPIAELPLAFSLYGSTCLIRLGRLCLYIFQASARRAVPALRGRWRRFSQGVSRRPVRQLPASGCVRWKRRPDEAEDQPRHVSQHYAGLRRESCCDWTHGLPRDERRRQIRVHS